jgi:pyruvate dehydrogenase (quinone)/pyruvate oxidase
MTAADVLVEVLLAWGVDTVFGLPGDGINGVMEALRLERNRIRFIQVRHEETAAFAACGYAKFTGRLGVCLATSGPGALHLINGLYDARLDGQPVLAITGAPYHDLIDTLTQQDVAMDRVFDDVALYNTRIMGPAHVASVANLACRAALSRGGVAHLTFPIDIQSMKVGQDTPSFRNRGASGNAHAAPRAGLPDPDELDRAVGILDAGKRVVILAGRGALGASDELEVLAEQLGAPIVKALLGKACVPDDSPYTTGSVGLLGSRPSQEALENCDTLLLVGTSFPYLEYYPRPGQAQCVQIDIDPVRIGLRHRADAALIGDARATLRELIPRVQRHADRAFLDEARRGMADWWKIMEERGTRPDVPMKPQTVAWELGKRLDDNAIVTCDSGTVATWWARQIKARRGQMFSLSGTLASMANGLPYAIGAAVAYPGRQVVAFVGDGAFSMLMADFATCVKYGLDVKVVVIKNNTLGQSRWEQMVFLGNPEYGCELHPIDFAAVARACGGASYTVADPKDLGAILDLALGARGPALVEAVVDPLEPPMPAKVTFEQAAHLAEALARGEPNRAKIALTAASAKIRELI